MVKCPASNHNRTASRGSNEYTCVLKCAPYKTCDQQLTCIFSPTHQELSLHKQLCKKRVNIANYIWPSNARCINIYNAWHLEVTLCSQIGPPINHYIHYFDLLHSLDRFQPSFAAAADDAVVPTRFRHFFLCCMHTSVSRFRFAFL